jgi:hypothetical protein
MVNKAAQVGNNLSILWISSDKNDKHEYITMAYRYRPTPDNMKQKRLWDDEQRWTWLAESDSSKELYALSGELSCGRLDHTFFYLKKIFRSVKEGGRKRKMGSHFQG